MLLLKSRIVADDQELRILWRGGDLAALDGDWRNQLFLDRAVHVSFNKPHPQTFYGGRAEGYVNYPALDAKQSEADLEARPM